MIRKKEQVKKYQDIKVRTYKFSISIITFIKKFKRYDLARDVIFKQLIRSATSIGANIIEGQAGASKKDFTNFYRIALKSSNETIYWLCLVRDVEKIDGESIEKLVNEATEISKILCTIVKKCS